VPIACRARILEGAEVLHPVGDEIETVDMAAVEFLIPPCCRCGASIAIWRAGPRPCPFLGVVHIRNFSLFLSNFAMGLWYITRPRGCRRGRIRDRSCPPTISGLTTGIGYCITLPVFRVHLPRKHLASRSTQALPSDRASRRAADQGFGRSYS